ncbi:MAG: hypothetical protein PHO93_00075 [Candidatus Saccharimonadaceae bacterium]|nr:hypothetical protein [Candidatus Saccharimonadaceae bacterium]
MNTAAEILVIILSVFLAFFLALGIVLAIYLIKLTREIREVTKSAERTVGNIESIVGRINSVTTPVIFAKMVTKFFNKAKKRKGKEDVEE